MKRWMVWMVMVGMVALASGCDDDGGGSEGQGGALEQGEGESEEDVFEGPDPDDCFPKCSTDKICDAGECISECGYCMETECAYEVSKCDSNWECPSLMSCLSGCSSDSCMENCLYSYYGGADDLLNLLECADDECSWEC